MQQDSPLQRSLIKPMLDLNCRFPKKEMKTAANFLREAVTSHFLLIQI
jgi:hypothetical protein